MFSIIKNLIVGVFIGISNVIPGVSGGTIACVFSLYENMLSLPSFDIKRLKDRWKEILMLYIGMGLGILLFSKLVGFVYQKYPIYTAYFFVGVIFASLFFLYDEATGKGSVEGRTQKGLGVLKILLCVIGFSIMFALYILKRRGVVFSFYGNGDTQSVAFYALIILYCAIASAGMIIPGISGAFILLLLGAYKLVIEAVASFNIRLLLPIATGVILGFFSTARLVRFLIERYRGATYSFILGLTVGSIMHIFPIVCQPFMQRFISALCLLLGYVLVTIFLKMDSINKLTTGENNG